MTLRHDWPMTRRCTKHCTVWQTVQPSMQDARIIKTLSASDQSFRYFSSFIRQVFAARLALIGVCCDVVGPALMCVCAQVGSQATAQHKDDGVSRSPVGNCKQLWPKAQMPRRRPR